MPFKVRATKIGFYNQILRQAGEVFELLTYKDGTYPLREVRVELKDAAGQSFDPPRYDRRKREVWKHPETGETMHRDYAPAGAIVEGVGYFEGENFEHGWMERVPDDIRVGIYALETDFGDRGPKPIIQPEQQQPKLVVTMPAADLGDAPAQPKPRRTGT